MEEVEIISLKLTSGEEIIGKLVSQEGNEWILQDARSILVSNDGRLQLGPTLFSAIKEKSVVIYRPAVAIYSEHIHPAFLAEYTKAVSPLTLPTSKIIMG